MKRPKEQLKIEKLKQKTKLKIIPAVKACPTLRQPLKSILTLAYRKSNGQKNTSTRSQSSLSFRKQMHNPKVKTEMTNGIGRSSTFVFSSCLKSLQTVFSLFCMTSLLKMKIETAKKSKYFSQLFLSSAPNIFYLDLQIESLSQVIVPSYIPTCISIQSNISKDTQQKLLSSLL